MPPSWFTIFESLDYLGIILGLELGAIALHLAMPFKWLKSKVKKLAFDINYWIKKIKNVKKLRGKRKFLKLKFCVVD